MDDLELHRNIANNLRQIRAKKRLSQDDLFMLSGISQQYISEIENEKVNPSIEIMYKISEALGVTINDLVYPSN